MLIEYIARSISSSNEGTAGSTNCRFGNCFASAQGRFGRLNIDDAGK